MTPATVCVDLPSRGNTAKALRAGAVCEPPAYDCVPPEEPTAKGCHGCRFAHGLTCSAAFASSVQTWQAQHLHPDLMTPKPNAPECPGRVSNPGN